MLLISKLIILLSCSGSNIAAKSREHHDISRFFGTKRIYPVVRLEDTKPPKAFKLVQVQLVTRHGSRNPTSGYIRKYDKLQIYLALNNPSNNFLATWENPFNESDGGLLLPHGLIEMRNLAARAKERYPASIFVKTKAFSSKSSRVINSATAFLHEMFTPARETSTKHRRIPRLHTKSRKDDNKLVFFENCQEYTRIHPNGTKKEAAHPEVKKWKERTFPRIIEAVQRRANLTIPLDDKLMYSMYSLCVYRTVLDPLVVGGGFCDFFGDRDLSELLYAEDLGFYYGYGYSDPIHTGMTCSLVTSLVSSMRKVISNTHKSKSSILMFAHDETMIPLATAFGLFKDDYFLNADNFRKDRKWVTSAVGPFGVNMWIELYKVEDELIEQESRQIRFMAAKKASAGDKFAVRLLHNEIPVAIPGCGQADSFMCPFDEFVETLTGKGLIGCDFDKVCGNKHK